MRRTSYVMSMNLEEKLKPRVRTPHQDISNHELSGTENQVVTGNKLKKKRKFTNFNVMYMGSSDAEGTPKRAKYEQHSETESVPQVPKRKKKGDVYIEEQTDQEIYGKKKKKKTKEESHQEAEDTRADEKIKKSHKPKESKSGGSSEEAPDSKIAELDGRSRKKKMKQKKDHGERPLDDEHVNESEDQAEDGSVQELLISETQHTRKKKKRKGCGGLQEDAFSEKLFSQLKRPNGSETLEQVEGINHNEKTVKKRRSKLDHHQATVDIAVDASSPFDGFCIEASSCSELIAIEHGLSQKKKKKSKKGHANHPMEGLIEESMTTSTADANKKSEGQSVDHAEAHGKKKKKQHCGKYLLDDRLAEDLCIVDAEDTKKKTKRTDDGDEGLRKHSFTANTEPLAESVEKTEVHMKKKKKSKKDSREPHQETDLIADDVSSVGLQSEKPSYNEFPVTEDGVSRKKKKKSKKDLVNHPMEELMEESMTTSTADVKKTKRNDGGGLQEDGFIEGFVSSRKSSDYPEQVVKNTEQAEKHIKKKKKERKDESDWEVGDITKDDVASWIGFHQDIPEEIKKVRKIKEPKSLGLAEESLYSEPVNIIDRSSVKKKKKSKKDYLLDDCLVEESTLTAQHISEKKTKREHGGDESQIQHRQEGQSVDQAEFHCKKKKKKHDGDEGHRKNSFTATTEPVAECLDEAEVHMIKKKKPKKDRKEPHQETDLTADVSSSLGLHSEEPSIDEFSGTKDGASQKKKKSTKHSKDRLFEDSLVEESSTPCVQHTSDKRAKWKDDGHESHRHHGFTEEFGAKKKHQSGSENKEQRDENEEVEKPIKKKKKKQKDEPPQEVDDMTADEALFAIGLCREEPSSSKFTGTEDTSRRLIKEKSNSHHWERFLENGLVEEDTEQSHRPQSSASSHAGPNPATQDKQQAKQNEGEKRSATLETGKNRRRKSISEAVREQDVALLQEYLPRMNNPNALKYLCCSEVERVKAAKRSGIMYRSGQFTVEEDEIIRKNAQEFASRFGIESPQMLFHTYLFPELKGTVLQLKRKYRFRTRLADGLHRFASHVYIRGTKLFSPGTIKGRFSNEEVAQLKMYREMFGRNWQMISCALNRNYDSVSMKSTQLHESNHGVWSTDETNRLIAAVKESVVDNLRKEKNGEEPVTVPKRRLYTGIPWFLVERKVETRLWTSCRTRWYNVMLMRMNNYINPFGKTLKIKAFIKTIRWLYDKNVKDYGDVKWDELSDHIGNVPTNYMQKTFHSWKKCVLGWKDMRLHAIVKGLYDDILPGLEAQLSAAEEIYLEPETKDEFLISEIFREYEECGEKYEA
ncbi:transcription termination factor 1 [Ranitomeya imitator]|uniref:transcription termination factor 1 n=1 Tax=Ranitomeya imitator TaxID=111125 RepID=UPI0037E8CD5A